MSRNIIRTLWFAATIFMVFSCSHNAPTGKFKREPASQKTYVCNGMYDPYLESEMEIELTSNPLFFRAKVVESDQFYSDKKHPMDEQACYGANIPDNDKKFTSFEAYIVPTSDTRNSAGYACEIQSIRISKNAGKDSKWPAVLFTKVSGADGIWFNCQ